MAFKMSNPFLKEDSKLSNKEIIQKYNMKKDDKGLWKDSKNRTVSQIRAGVTGAQGTHNTNIKKIKE